MRRARKILFAVSVVVFAWLFTLTSLAIGYLALTNSTVSPPAGLTFVRTGAYETRYESWGATGTPVVLVPGFLESADTWAPVAERLATTHRVVSYDVAGFGYTQRVGPYGTVSAAAQLIALVRTLGLVRPVLVGHSAGAAVIAAAVLDDPGLASGVVFVDGDGLMLGAGPPRALTALLVDPYRTAFVRLLSRSDWFVRTVYTLQCGPRCPPLDAAGIELWRRPLQVPGAVAALWSLARAGGLGLPSDQVARLAQLPIPKRVVFGADDQVFGSGAAQATADRIGAPPAEIISGARHLSLISDPGVIATVIARIS